MVLKLADPEDVGLDRHGDRLGAFTGDVPGDEIRQIVFGIGVLQARGMGDGPVTRISGRLVAVGHGCPEGVELHEHAASGTQGKPDQVEVRMDAAPPASGNGRIAAEQALLGRRFHRKNAFAAFGETAHDSEAFGMVDAQGQPTPRPGATHDGRGSLRDEDQHAGSSCPPVS